MDSPQRFKLIDGTFSPAEATEILLNLVKSKIDYHRLRLARDEHRFGKDLAHSERRIEQLKQLEAELKKALSCASAQGHQLEVSGWFEIRPAPGKP
jgi:hypothetical protein